MLSGSFGRVVRSTCTASTSIRAPSGCLAAIKPIASPYSSSSHSTLRSHASHQRRQSSSKTSIPPDGSKPAPASRKAANALGKTAADKSAAGPLSKDASPRSLSSGRVGRRKAKATVEASQVVPHFSKQYPNLPSVPSTQHLQQKDINISSFFALHRPISVTTPFPESTNEADFAALFDTNSKTSKKKQDDVIYTVGNFAESLMQYSEQYESDNQGGPYWRVVQDNFSGFDGDVRNLDVTQPQQVEKWVSRLPPHRTPPPPEPIVEAKDQPKKKASKTRSPKSKSTTIIVTLTEYTNPSGEKSYSQATGTPIIRVPSHKNPQNTEPAFFETNPITDVQTFEEPWESFKPSFRQTFLNHMSNRQQRWQSYREERAVRYFWGRRDMLLISVKRQRKLKMKKHKYKKLMRRTRNERRKLGKL